MSKLVQISSQVRIRFGSTRPNCSPKKYGNKINKIKKLKNSSINYRYIPKIMHFSFSLVQASKLFNYTFLAKAISIAYKVTRQCRKRQDHDAIKILGHTHRYIYIYIYIYIIKKTKIFNFFYSVKSNMLISTNITKLNLLSNMLISTNITKLNLLITSSLQLYWLISTCYF